MQELQELQKFGSCEGFLQFLQFLHSRTEKGVCFSVPRRPCGSRIVVGVNQRGISAARGGAWSAVQVKRVLERA